MSKFFPILPLAASILLILSLLVGCGATFRYGTKTFSNANLALAEQSKILANIINEIKPLKEPEYNKGLVIIADYAAISNKSVIKNRTSSTEIVDYVTKATLNDLHFMADAIKKYNLFKSLEVRETGNPQKLAHKKSNEYTIIVFYKLVDPKDQNWQLLTSNNTVAIDLVTDTKEEIGTPRTQKWLDDMKSELDNHL